MPDDVAVSERPKAGRGLWYEEGIALWILGGIGVIVLVVIIVSVSGGDSSSTAEQAGPPLDVSVSEIFEAYQENEARANATYKNRLLNLSFEVDEIEDKYVVQEMDDWVDAQLKFEQSDLLVFNIGDRANRICELDGFQLDTFLEFDCR